MPDYRMIDGALGTQAHLHLFADATPGLNGTRRRPRVGRLADAWTFRRTAWPAFGLTGQRSGGPGLFPTTAPAARSEHDRQCGSTTCAERVIHGPVSRKALDDWENEGGRAAPAAKRVRESKAGPERKPGHEKRASITMIRSRGFV